MQFALEFDEHAAMQHALAQKTLADAGRDQQIGAVLLEQAGAQPVLDVIPAPVLEDNGGDPLQMEEVGKHQTGRACSDNGNLRPHRFNSLLRRGCATRPHGHSSWAVIFS